MELHAMMERLIFINGLFDITKSSSQDTEKWSQFGNCHIKHNYQDQLSFGCWSASHIKANCHLNLLSIPNNLMVSLSPSLTNFWWRPCRICRDIHSVARHHTQQWYFCFWGEILICETETVRHSCNLYCRGPRSKRTQAGRDDFNTVVRARNLLRSAWTIFASVNYTAAILNIVYNTKKNMPECIFGVSW